MVPPRAGVPFTPMDTRPLLLPQLKQVPWSHQVPSVPSRVRGGAGVRVAQLGGDRLFWLASSVQGSESLVMAGKRESLVPPLDLVTQPLKVDGQRTQELCRCEQTTGQVLLK